MWFNFHLWIELTMSIVFWGKVFLDIKKHRVSWQEKWMDLALDLFLALVFSIGFVDLFLTLPQIVKLLNILRGVS